MQPGRGGWLAAAAQRKHASPSYLSSPSMDCMARHAPRFPTSSLAGLHALLGLPERAEAAPLHAWPRM